MVSRGFYTHFLLAIWAALAWVGLSAISDCWSSEDPYLSPPPCVVCDLLLIIPAAPPHLPPGMSRRPHVTGADAELGRGSGLRIRSGWRTRSTLIPLLPCACVLTWRGCVVGDGMCRGGGAFFRGVWRCPLRPMFGKIELGESAAFPQPGLARPKSRRLASLFVVRPRFVRLNASMLTPSFISAYHPNCLCGCQTLLLRRWNINYCTSRRW